MKLESMTYRWLWGCLLAGGLLMSGCGEKQENMPQPEPEQGSPLMLRTMTRTDGATPFVAGSDWTIRTFLTEATSVVEAEGLFQYTGAVWNSNLSVKEERQYYLYGYMPSTLGGTFAVPASGKYSDGVDLTFSNLPDISGDDPCVVVGVQRVESETSTAEVTEGHYGYLSGIVGKNYVNLLMGHLYSSLQLAFKLDEQYAQLRSIRLKEVMLNSTFGNVSTTLNIRSGYGVGAPTFTKIGDANRSVPFLSTTESPKVLGKEHVINALTLDQMVYCAPSIFDANGTYVSITTKYDVLDKQGNDLGERTSTNKLRITASSLIPGQKKLVTISVRPSYLYVLSDFDLDNPVLTIE